MPSVILMTSRRLLVCMVGAMCTSAPPAGGFTPAGCLGAHHTCRRLRYAPRNSGAGDTFYATERRLVGGRRSSQEDRCGGLRVAGYRRRRGDNTAQMMSTVAPSAATVQRPTSRTGVPQEIRPEEELRIKMEEAGIKRPPIASAAGTPASLPRPTSPRDTMGGISTRASSSRRARSARGGKVNFTPGRAGRQHDDAASDSSGRGGGATSLQFYLRNMAKTQLLNAEEEKVLGRQIQKGIQFMKVREHLLSVRGAPPTKEEWSFAAGVEVHDLVSQLQKAERAKVAMINANLRLVVSVTKRYRLLGMAFTDLIQEGTFGLMRAAEKFDPERGFRFSTYAVWWIRQAAMRGVMDQLLMQVKRATKELQTRDGSEPKDEAVGSLLGTTEHRIQYYRKAAQAIISMQTKTIGPKPQDSTKEDEIGDIMKAAGLSPETDVSTVVLRDRVVQLLSKLNHREQEVMKARFGIDGDKRKTLELIGQRYGLSRERVRQIETDALLKLRQPYHAYRDLEINAEQVMIYAETAPPDTSAMEAASAEVAEAEAAAKVAQLNYMRARLGMPRATPRVGSAQGKPEAVTAQASRVELRPKAQPEPEPEPEISADFDVGEELTNHVADRIANIFGEGGMDPSLSGESPEEWARRVLAEQPLLGTPADKLSYSRRNGRTLASPSSSGRGKDRGDGEAVANPYATVEISAKSLMTLTGDVRETWSSMIEQTEPWSGPVQGESSERVPLEIAAEQWSFGVESAKLSGDMTPEQWERALATLE